MCVHLVDITACVQCMLVIRMSALHFEDFFIMDGVVLSDSMLTVHVSCLLVGHSTILITLKQCCWQSKYWFGGIHVSVFLSAQKLKKIDWKWIATYVLWSTLPTRCW